MGEVCKALVVHRVCVCVNGSTLEECGGRCEKPGSTQEVCGVMCV